MERKLLDMMNQLSISEYNPRMEYCDRFQFVNLPFARGEILFFHAMGVTGESSMPIAEKMADKFYCVMPTSTVYCSGQKYRSKKDEVQQIIRFLRKQGIKEIELVVASSIGADLELKSSGASKLISNLVQADIIEPVSGHGKGKYKFKK